MKKYLLNKLQKTDLIVWGSCRHFWDSHFFRNGVGFLQIFHLDLLAILLLVDGLGKLSSSLLLRSKSISYSHSIWFIFLSLALIWLNRLSSLPVNLVVICLGAYQFGECHCLWDHILAL